MPVTVTQDVWNTRRIDVRHINPSIMEGERGHTSLFGQGSAVTIIRYAPTFLVQPSISGSFKIPSVLTCNPGVIDASPQADLFYQWKADGVGLLGETSPTITTYLELDAVTLTCEVTAVNFLGVAVGESNGITAELIEPIINQQFLHYAVTGLNQEQQINTFKSDTLITTGISMSQRIDMQQHVILIPTGMWVELRHDVMSATAAVITGLGGDNGGQLYDFDVYTVWQPTPLDPQPVVVNPDGSSGLTGWTVTQGSVQALTTADGADARPKDLTHFFKADTQPGLTDSIMYQDIPIDAAHNAAIDAGTVMMDAMYWVDSQYGYDGVTTQIQCLDGSDVVLSTLTRTSAYNETYQNRNWQGYMFDLDYIPATTRKIRFTVTFDQWLNNFTADNNGYFTGLQVRLTNDI